MRLNAESVGAVLVWITRLYRECAELGSRGGLRGIRNYLHLEWGGEGMGYESCV